jgi:hypothetical protein
MFKSQRPIRFSAVRFGIIAIIGISFLTLTVAGTSAANLSFFDSLKGFFGVQQAAQSVSPADNSETPLVSTTLVISQVYGGGGGSTGTYLNDYVEIKNVSASPQSLNTLSLLYGSATGNFASSATNAFALPDVTLNPGQYFLVELGAAGTGGAPLPVTPDATTTNLSMGAASGKVALATAAFPTATCGATATPCTPAQLALFVDWVAYGAGGNGAAGNGEGGTSVNNGVAMLNTQGGVRKGNGCQDTDNNNNDFDAVTAPVPRNRATVAAQCAGGPTATASPSPTHTFTPTPTNTPTSTATGTPASSPTPQAGTLVISQFDGGGGGSTGTYLADYVEIKNVSGSVQTLNGLWLYYGSATGLFASTASNAFELPSVSLNPGQYYLVQLGMVGTGGAPFPVTPDATTVNLNMSGTSGKVALTTAALPQNTCGSSATPCTPSQLALIVDWVAYGAAGNGVAGNGEGGTSVNNGVAMTATQGGVRKQNGCQDTNNNNNDFDVVTGPVPRNSASAAMPCAVGPTATPTNTFTPTATATSTPTGNPSGRAAFDYDADHKTDISVFRPADGAWYLQRSQAGPYGALFGIGSDKITPADYDGDGKTDLAVYRPSDGIWYVLNSSDGTVSYYVFGLFDDLPTPADYDGDGKADVSVFRPSTGTWYRQNSSNGTFFGLQFGATGDSPIVGDFDGDSKSDIAVFRPSTGAWYWINSQDNSIHGEIFGFGTDVLTPADYDGDRKIDLAVFRPTDGYWYVRRSSDGGFAYYVFGLSDDIPTPGDYDGDGKADVSVFRASTGTWYRQNSSNGTFFAFPFGTFGDKPTMTAFRY